MSHFTTVETKVNSLSALAKACEKLGYAFTQGDVEIRNYYGHRMNAQAKIQIPHASYAIGVVREPGEEESYALTGDWMMLGGAPVQDQLLREYALARVLESCAAEGYSIDSSEIRVNEDGSMALVAVAWGE